MTYVSRRDQTWARLFRVEAVVQQKAKCAYCYCPITMRTATADHVKARKLGGTTKRENILAACTECNVLKGHKTATAFKTLIKNPEPGCDIRIWLAWSRRRIFLAADRSCARIMKAAALTPS